MVLWGGLRPIISHAVIDAITLSSFAYVAGTKPSVMSWGIFGFAAGLAVAASRTLTNRWTIIFPMGPLMILQLLRLFLSGYKVNKMRWIARILTVVSFMLIVISAILSILFPAVELASYNSFGQFNVGVVDLYLPIDLQYTSSFEGTSHVVPTRQDHATIRILYPTLEEPMAIPYLRPHTSEVYCEENMKHSAPPPLRPFSWMIHNWRLIHLPAKHNAQPALGSSQQGEPTSLLPVVFFSHGLGGSAEMYAYQTHALAKHGYVVVVLDHSDGSAPAVARKDGQILRRNETILQHWFDGDKDFYRLLRQTMTDYRSQELLAVVDGILNLNSENLPELEAVGLDFRNKLDISDIHYMGHSFGGATALHAASQKPPKSVLAHDPASDWMPHTSRLALFDIGRLRDSTTNHSYWTSHRNSNRSSNGLNEDENENKPSSLHDSTELFVLFSDEWYQKNYAGVDVLKDMYDRKVFGPAGGVSKLGVIEDAYHQEFSDACMITPLWIAREVGLTGPRNPLDTAREIHIETVNFLKDLSIN